MKLTNRQQRALDFFARNNNSATFREIQLAAGVNNAAELMRHLKKKGFDFVCSRVQGVDRDGHKIQFGEYHLLPGALQKAKDIQ